MRFDWLNVTFDSSKLDEVIEYLTAIEGTFSEQEGGMHGYKSVRATSAGVRLAWSDGRKDALVSFPGKSIAFQSWLKTRGVVNFLDSIEGRASRVDLAYDDTAGIMQMSDFVEAVRIGKYEPERKTICGPKTFNTIDGTDGTTCYFGRRGSAGGNKVIVAYDKAAEQRIEGRHWVRLEVRFQHAGAAVVFRDLARRIEEKCSQEGLVGAISRWIAGSLDFREPGADGDRHLERRDRCAWWDRVVRHLGEPQLLSVPVTETHVEKIAAWLDRSVAPALAMLRDVTHDLGDDFAQIVLDVLDNNIDRVRWDRLDARKQGVTRERLYLALGLPHPERTDGKRE